MKNLVIAGVVLLVAGAGLAQDNALGLYFSDTEFTAETAQATIEPDFTLAAYVVLTGATGSAVSGYEVNITCTAEDFAVPLTNLVFGENSGTNTNQLVQFFEPVPVAEGGTVLSFLVLATSSTEYEEISFGPADPSSLPDGVPVVDFGGGDLQPCSYPFGSPVVARLNVDTVPVAARSWSQVRTLFGD